MVIPSIANIKKIASARPEIGNNEISKRQKTSISAAATQG